MSTVRRSTESRSSLLVRDPFFYGTRWTSQPGPDGKLCAVAVPMTEWDVLHPQEGDQITQNTPHNRDCRYLTDVSELRLVGIPATVVLCDCQVDLGLLDVKPVGPDLVICRRVRTRGPWSSFSVPNEGAELALLLEVTSPSTRRVDLEEKPRLYWRAGALCYVIVDQVSMRRGVRQLRLLAYERGTRRFRRMRLRRGRVWLEAIQVWLGIRDGRVVCWDAAGNELLPYAEAVTAAAERIRQLEEENRRLRGGA